MPFLRHCFDKTTKWHLKKHLSLSVKFSILNHVIHQRMPTSLGLGDVDAWKKVDYKPKHCIHVVYFSLEFCVCCRCHWPYCSRTSWYKTFALPETWSPFPKLFCNCLIKNPGWWIALVHCLRASQVSCHFFQAGETWYAQPSANSVSTFKQSNISFDGLFFRRKTNAISKSAQTSPFLGHLSL